MTRRDFLVTTAAGVAVVACSPMKTLNIAQLGTFADGQLLLITPPDGLPTGFVRMTVPEGQAWNVKYIRFVFTTSAVVGNRTLLITCSYQGQFPYQMHHPLTQAASIQNAYVMWPCGSDNAPVTGQGRIMMPELWMPPNGVIELNATGLQVGDQFTAITLTALAVSAV